MPDEQASEAASFLTRKISFPGENARFCDPDRKENDLFAEWKRIGSDRVRNAPLLHLNYQDTRMVMGQNANGIATNDIYSGHLEKARQTYNIEQERISLKIDDMLILQIKPLV